MLSIPNPPKAYTDLLVACKEIGFTMPSDIYIGTLLKTLVASKPNGHFLELGTGIGLSLAWMADGMDKQSTLITVDYDRQLIEIVKKHFLGDARVTLVCQDGTEWVQANKHQQFDLIFADTWAGKYTDLEEVLGMLRIGGIYVIDDMTPQDNWPKGHAKKATQLIDTLEKRADLTITKMNWSTGVIVASKIQS